MASETYAEGLRQTIDLLQHEADDASVTLPPKYNFSFSAQCSLVRFAPGSLEPLAAQLGEVKAIAEILFAARVNDLDGIQRVRVSDDDTAGLQSDYIDERPITNDLAVITPYVITFRCFTPELARVISGFANSPNPFIVKSINVQPAARPSAQLKFRVRRRPIRTAPGGAMGLPGAPLSRTLGCPDGCPGAAAAAATGKGGLQTVLKEQLLRDHPGGGDRETAAQELTWTSSKNITKRCCSA